MEGTQHRQTEANATGASADTACDWLIVGGGVHGVCVGTHLLAAGVPRDRLRIVDPHDELLASFESRARTCGTRTLRSPVGHHVAVADDSLEQFAVEHDREVELLSTTDYPRRPTLDLFLDHARTVVHETGLSDCHVRATVTGLNRADTTEETETAPETETAAKTETAAEAETDLWRVATTAGSHHAHNVVLAVGLDSGPSLPDWARELPADAPVWHVWEEEFELACVTDDDRRPVVIGGGVTAAQLACRLAAETPTTLLCRSGMETEQAEAAASWAEWEQITTRLHTYPPGAPERHELVRRERNDGTIPPYLRWRIQKARSNGALTTAVREVTDLSVEQATTETATAGGVTDADGGQQSARQVDIHLNCGTTLENVAVVLATGVESVVSDPLVETVAAELELARDEAGYPILDDTTLAWRRRDGTRTSVFVTGSLALTTVGPLAPNVVGARLAARRLSEVAERVSHGS